MHALQPIRRRSRSRAARRAVKRAVDANADGVISLQELQAVTPSVIQDQLNAYDEIADGALIPSAFAKLQASMGDGERDQASPSWRRPARLLGPGRRLASRRASGAPQA